MEWYIRRKEEERKRKEEEKKEQEKLERPQRVKIKKEALLEKLKVKREFKRGLVGKDREWIETRKNNWRKYREEAGIDEREESDIFNKLMERVKIREPRIREYIVENTCNREMLILRKPSLILKEPYRESVKDGNSVHNTDLNTDTQMEQVENEIGRAEASDIHRIVNLTVNNINRTETGHTKTSPKNVNLIVENCEIHCQETNPTNNRCIHVTNSIINSKPSDIMISDINTNVRTNNSVEHKILKTVKSG